MSQTESPDCTLRLVAQGRPEPCPEGRCVFWEPGGAVAEAGCLVDRLGVDVRRDGLAHYLLEVRERFERDRGLAEAEAAHREFAHRLGRDV